MMTPPAVLPTETAMRFVATIVVNATVSFERGTVVSSCMRS